MIKKICLSLMILFGLMSAIYCSKAESSKEKAEREKTYLEKTVDSYLESNRKLKEAEKNLDCRQKEYQKAEQETDSSGEEKQK